jgi:hypothetical protein
MDRQMRFIMLLVFRMKNLFAGLTIGTLTFYRGGRGREEEKL